MSDGDPWDPGQYDRFKAERRQPFDDLVALCSPVPGGTAVDLGCGTGELTAVVHRSLELAETTGIDSSPAMLARAPKGVRGLSFADGDLGAWCGPPVDVVFANASLHWVPDHPALLARLRGGLRAGGQLAFQVPANFDHPSHVIAREVASEPPFAAALAADPPPDPGQHLLAPTSYASVLYDLGARSQVVRLQVYGHELASTDAVVEWVLGTLLTPYRSRLDDAVFAQFLEEYRRRLGAALGERRPYFYGFARIVCWARFGRVDQVRGP